MAPFDPDKEVIENPTWEEHIRHFFSKFQIDSMIWFCDLSNYNDVAKYSSKIYARVIAPQNERGMPPSQPKKIPNGAKPEDYKPWSENKKKTFYNWATNGAPQNSSELA